MKLIEEQALERRERILEATRQFIAEHGAVDLTIRDLARACRVSVPTLYRTFGSKQDLLAEAIRSFFNVEVLGQALESTGLRGHQRMLKMIDLCGQSISNLPDYNRQLVALYLGSDVGRSLSWEITEQITNDAERALQEISAAGELLPWVDQKVLAERIAAQCIVVSLEFASGTLTEEGYHAAFGYTTAMMMAAVTTGEARLAFDDRIHKSQQTAARTGRPLTLIPEKRDSGEKKEISR